MEITNQSNQQLNEADGFFTPYNVDVTSLSESTLRSYISRIKELPADFRKILFAFSTAEFIELSLGHNYQLSQAQKNTITRLVRDVLLGVTPYNAVSQVLREKVGLDLATSEQIKKELTTNLFANIMNKLQLLYPQKPTSYPGQDLPETGGNIIDLRKN